MPRFMVNTKWYGWNVREGEKRRAGKRMLLFTLLNLVLSLLCGLVPTGVTRHNWVSFAATAALIALAVELIGVVRFLRARDQMDQRTFQGIDNFIRVACVFHMILTGVAVAAAVVSCIQQFSGLLDILVLLGLAATGLCSFLTFRMYRALPTFEMDRPD